jgi:hypothetical protein
LEPTTIHHTLPPDFASYRLALTTLMDNGHARPSHSTRPEILGCLAPTQSRLATNFGHYLDLTIC